MLAACLGRRQAFAELTVAGVVQTPFARIVLGTPDAVDGIVRPIALADCVTENAAEQSQRAGRGPLTPVTIARPRRLVFTSAADFPLMTSRRNRVPSEEVKSLTVRLPISGIICRWIRPLSE